MENHFEKKPITLIITLGAIILLILGAGVISTYFNKPVPSPAVLPDSPYGISWSEATQVIAAGPVLHPAEARFSLLDASYIPLTFTEGIEERHGLTLHFGALVSTASSSSAEKVCDWKLPESFRRVADEVGTLVTPQENYFKPKESTCIELNKPLFIEQKFIFPVPDSENEFLFTTGSSSQIFFIVTVSTTGTVQIERAPQEIPG